MLVPFRFFVVGQMTFLDRNQVRIGALMDAHSAAFVNATQVARLPVYLLLDCSGSMLGAKLTGVSAGVTAICETLRSDPRSAATVHMSVIWFNDHAHETPLVPITLFAVPELRALGLTALGEALMMLNGAMDRDLRPALSGASAPPDYRPLVFLLTDGQPSDEWEAPAAYLRHRTVHVPLHIIGLAIGDDAREEQIAQVATVVLKIDGDLPNRLREYFDWVAETVILATEQQSGQQPPSEEGGTPALPRLPKTINRSRNSLGL